MKAVPVGLLFVFAAALLPAQAATVTVEVNDTLSRIAARVWADPKRWPEICAANADLIGDDCDRILPGMKLTVPDPAGKAPAKVAMRFELAGVVAPKSPVGFASVRLRNGTTALAGYTRNPVPSGRTGAISFALPPSLETAASGKTVRVTIRATTNAVGTGTVALSYSTNEVGNSGWQKLKLDPGTGAASFAYAVPRMAGGYGDFIGVQPDPGNIGQVLYLTGLTVEVLE